MNGLLIVGSNIVFNDDMNKVIVFKLENEVNLCLKK